MKKQEIPTFKNEAEEADWWSSAAGRRFVKQHAQTVPAPQGSRLVVNLAGKKSVQIAIRLPGEDIRQARQIAFRKGIGYQTLLKMLVHEGLRRETKRGA